MGGQGQLWWRIIRDRPLNDPGHSSERRRQGESTQGGVGLSPGAHTVAQQMFSDPKPERMR
jgi:hypothetical protein